MSLNHLLLIFRLFYFVCERKRRTLYSSGFRLGCFVQSKSHIQSPNFLIQGSGSTWKQNNLNISARKKLFKCQRPSHMTDIIYLYIICFQLCRWQGNTINANMEMGLIFWKQIIIFLFMFYLYLQKHVYRNRNERMTVIDKCSFIDYKNLHVRLYYHLHLTWKYWCW